MGLLSAAEKQLLRSGALFGQRGAEPTLASRMQWVLQNGYPDSGGDETALRYAWDRLGMTGQAPISADSVNISSVPLSDLPDYANWVQRQKRDWYSEVLDRGDPPPILIARDSRTGRWDILDGNHRVAALRRAGRKEIAARDVTPIFEGRYLMDGAS